MATALADLGNGTGWIYYTLSDGTTVIGNVVNNTQGAAAAKQSALENFSTTSSTTLYDASFRMEGARYFLSSNASAVQGVIYGPDNLEITSSLVGGRGKTNPYQTAAIATGVATISRNGAFQILSLTGEGGIADTLDTITMSGAVNGDRLEVYGLSAGQVITIPNGTGNVFVSGSTSFLTSTPQSRITLSYNNQGGATAGWYEVGRSAASLYPNITNLRANSVPVPIAGWATQAINGAGGTITLTAGSSKGFQEITGNAALAGSYTIDLANGVNDGDEFWIKYSATMTPGAFVISVEGITMTPAQVLAGKTIFYAKWSAGAVSWIIISMLNANNTDYSTSVDTALKENALGNPASNGMMLSSTTAGTRSWIAPPNAIVYNTTANNGTTAIITEEFLKTYAMPGATLDTDGDVLYCKTVYQTAANANAKTETFYFGATAVATITGNFNASTIVIEGTVTRTGAATQVASFRAAQYVTATGAWGAENSFYTTPTETLSGAINVRAASTNGVAAVNDSINRTMFVQKMDK